MNDIATDSNLSFGFLSVREIPGLGHCGGLLVVSKIGRPIEFHCSAPIATNRSHEILYGKTYRSFLYCDQIGIALVEKAKLKPNLLIADSPCLMGLNQIQDTPVVAIANKEQDQPLHLHPSRVPYVSLLLNEGQEILLDPRQGQMESGIKSLIETFTQSLPLDEPFERIENAIEEAQTIAQ